MLTLLRTFIRIIYGILPYTEEAEDREAGWVPWQSQTGSENPKGCWRVAGLPSMTEG